MSTSQIQSYIQASVALRDAYDEVKYGKLTRSKFLAETFQPIVKPLENLNEKLTEGSHVQIIEKSIGDTAMKYLKMYSDKSVKTDKTFGLCTKDEKMFIGGEPVVIKNNNIHFSDGEIFEGTDGLWQLLTLQKPESYTEEDYNNFAEIVMKTHSYRRNNDPDEKYLKSSSGYKYSHIVKPILIDNEILEAPLRKKGKGLQKIVTNKPVEYVYWNSLDELLEKLYIAYGEIKSGNKNPLLYNEIISILEEIREI